MPFRPHKGPEGVSRRSDPDRPGAYALLTRGRRLEEWRSPGFLLTQVARHKIRCIECSFRFHESLRVLHGGIFFFQASRVVDKWCNGGYTGAKWGKVGKNTKQLFIGQYEHGIDDKNRLFIPSRFREKNRGPDYILTQGLERCLFLFPIHYWQDLAQKLDTLELSNKSDERAFKRVLLSAACEAEVDSQGRILIPQHLKEYAGISRQITILGVLRHVELWSKEHWLRYSKGAKTSFNKLAPRLAL